MATNKWYAKTRTKFGPGGNGGNRCQWGKSVSVHRYCGSRSLPVASASSVSPAVVAVHHAKRCFDTGFSRHAKRCFDTGFSRHAKSCFDTGFPPLTPDFLVESTRASQQPAGSPGPVPGESDAAL